MLEAVADAEGIEVCDEELLEALAATAEREGTKPEKLLERLVKSGRDVPIRRELRLRKAVDVAGRQRAADRSRARRRRGSKLWTPEKQRKGEGSAQLWTPAAGKAERRKEPAQPGS